MSNKEMIYLKKYSCWLLFFLYVPLLNAQIASQIFTINNNDNVSVEKINSDAFGNLLFSGLFDGSLELDGVTFQSRGENDIYIGKRDGETLLWMQAFGSIGQDEILALTSDNENNIYVAGSYFESIDIGTIVLTPKTGVRGHYIAKLSPSGEVIWVKDVNSSGEQVIGDLVVDDAFNVYICGYFGGILQVENIEMAANAETDLMVLQFSENGTIQQAYQAGVSGNIWGRSIAINPDNSRISVSGVYKGAIDFDGEVIQTNTNDFDVFVLQLNEDFEVQWAKKAGGVYEDRNTKILSDEADNMYVIGDFQGVLRLGETFEITSNGVQDNNLYILKYDKNGIPLFARSLGGINIDLATDATWSNTNQIAVIGSYQTEIQMGEFSQTAIGFYNMYTAGISSENGDVEWLEGLKGDNLLLGNSVANVNGQLVVGGSFIDSIIDEDELIENNGSFDGYLKYFDPVLTPITPVLKETQISIYPNPTSDIIYINTNESKYQIDIYSVSGQLLKSYENPNSIDVTSFQNGIYLLQCKNAQGNIHYHKVIRSDF